jgi:CubicO group peptidase (beta-lactamase class C family)
MTSRALWIALAACSHRASSPPDGAPVPAGFDCTPIAGAPSQQFYEDNPTYFDPVDDDASWTFSEPSAVQLDPARLQQAADALAAKPNLWSFLVVRHGALVFERYFNGSDRHSSNNVHSASKSIWGAAIGIAIERGLLAGPDVRIADVLPARYASLLDATKQTITVGNLLTMTSGLAWVEDSTEEQIQQQPDRVAAILSLPSAAAPGARFNYSTGDAHVVSAVLTAAAGRPACEVIHDELLTKLGIAAEHWARDPQGYFTGGYNLYFTPRELATFGMLYLAGGVWHGEQLVPTSWVDTSLADHVDAGSPYTYGYDFWLRSLAGHRVAMAWGFAGQMIYVIKDLDVVVVMTTNTHDFSADTFDGGSIVESYVIPAAI